MPRWMKDKLTWILVLAFITAGSSGYSAYKIYLMTDGKPAPAKGRRYRQRGPSLVAATPSGFTGLQADAAHQPVD